MNGQLLLMWLGRQLGRFLGVSSGQKKGDRDICRWTKEVQERIRGKRLVKNKLG